MSLAEALALIGVLLATITDWRDRKVPNWLTLTLIVSGIAIGTYTNGLGGFIHSIVGTCLGIVLFVYPFSMGWMGGGDVKLLAATGALVGAQSVLWVALYGAIAGGIGALALVVYRTVSSGVFLAQLRLSIIALGIGLSQGSSRLKSNGPSIVLPATRRALREKFPYAFAIAIGTIVVLWQGPL